MKKQSGHCEEKEKNVNKKGNASRYLFSSCIMYLHEAEMQNEDVTIFRQYSKKKKKKKRSYLLMSSWSGSCVFQASVHFRSPAPPVTRVLGRWFLCVDISVIGAAPALLRAQAQRSTYVHSRLESAPLASVSIYLFTAVKPLLMD